jgi:hypothetical protein
MEIKMNKRLIKLAGLLNEDIQPVNEATESKGFEKAKENMQKMIDFYKQSQRLRNSIKREFESEATKYKRGRWDIIDLKYTGNNRWGGERRKMENDILNFYNAKIRNIWVDEFAYGKTGEPGLIIGIEATGDNVSGDHYCKLSDLSILPAYTSEEGKAFEEGY